MKKILSLFILFLSVGLFAETGYAGKAWGTNKNDLILDHVDNNTMAKPKIVLGLETTVFYHFIGDKLYGVSYSISNEKTKELKSKYKELLHSFDFSELTDEQLNNIKKKNGIDESAILYLTNKLIYNMAFALEVKGIPKEPPKKGNCKLLVYNYNDDTRVYMLENFRKGECFVTYIYHEQDY